MVKQVKKAQTSIKSYADFDNKKSPYIRYLTAEGKSRKEIVQIFADQNVKIRYQHVRNVQVTQLAGK